MADWTEIRPTIGGWIDTTTRERLTDCQAALQMYRDLTDFNEAVARATGLARCQVCRMWGSLHSDRFVPSPGETPLCYDVECVYRWLEDTPFSPRAVLAIVHDHRLGKWDDQSFLSFCDHSPAFELVLRDAQRREIPIRGFTTLLTGQLTTFSGETQDALRELDEEYREVIAQRPTITP